MLFPIIPPLKLKILKQASREFASKVFFSPPSSSLRVTLPSFNVKRAAKRVHLAALLKAVSQFPPQILLESGHASVLITQQKGSTVPACPGAGE